MNNKEIEIAKQHLEEIIEYQSVLSYMLKRKITIKQAMIDWIEKGYAQQYHQ